TDLFFSVTGDPDVVRYIRAPKTKEESDAFLIENVKDYELRPNMGRWAVELREDGQYAGSFAIIPVPHSEKIQLGYALIPKYWGQGFATELTKEGLNYVFNKMMLDEIYGVTEKANTASQNVLEKCGFSFFDSMIEEGKELKRYVYYRKDYPLSVSI